MARTGRAGVLADRTPLAGPQVDVGVRAGWVLRMARLTGVEAAAGGGPEGRGRPPGLEAMAARLGTSTTQVHRVETGARRIGRVADGYEELLGLPPASLRAPIDLWSRTFRYAAPDADPGDPVTSAHEMSVLTERVAADPTGADWLRWARALAQPGAIGLPESLGLELVRRLAGELARATGHGFPPRYEALALLRCSGYGHLVLEAARDLVADPHVQSVNDLMSAVGEAATPEAVAWCLELLGSDRDLLVVGGALALEEMAGISDDGFWSPLVAPLVDRYDAAADDAIRHEWLSHLLRLVPNAALTASLGPRRPSRPLAPAPAAPRSPNQVDRRWSLCEAAAHRITDAAGVVDQPVLARMVFDIAIGPFETRAASSSFLLGALPAFAVEVGVAVADVADSHDDPLIRERAGRRLGTTLHGDLPAVAAGWLESGTPDQRTWALRLGAATGHPLSEAALRDHLAHPDVRAAALQAAGMTGHPYLRVLADDPDASPETRGAAAWWLAGGARVTV